MQSVIVGALPVSMQAGLQVLPTSSTQPLVVVIRGRLVDPGLRPTLRIDDVLQDAGLLVPL